MVEPSGFGFVHMLQEKPLDREHQGLTARPPLVHHRVIIGSLRERRFVAKKYRGPKDAMVRLDRERLKAERKKRSLTLEKIAFESDDAFSSSTYKRAEGGQEISILMAQEIATFLGAELDELLAKAISEEVAAAEPAAPAAEEPPPAVEAEPTVEAEPIVEEPPPDVGPEPPPPERLAPEPSPSDSERIAVRYMFLEKAALRFIDGYHEKYGAKLTLSQEALYRACVQYFEFADDMKRRYLPTDHRLSPVRIGALTCYAIVRNRPISPGAFKREEANDDELAVYRYANEMMGISIGASIANVDIAASMMVLVEMFANNIDKMNFFLAFQLLKRRTRGPDDTGE